MATGLGLRRPWSCSWLCYLSVVLASHFPTACLRLYIPPLDGTWRQMSETCYVRSRCYYSLCSSSACSEWGQSRVYGQQLSSADGFSLLTEQLQTFFLKVGLIPRLGLRLGPVLTVPELGHWANWYRCLSPAVPFSTNTANGRRGGQERRGGGNCVLWALPGFLAMAARSVE